jgi:ABC-type thiamin/hydroxymethylpyrimidine transport system permease subunit
MEENMVRRKEYYFSNRDLLVIAILSGIGGVMSTYVGYLGNLVNRLFGVPYGAGQFVSGLHVFWFILVAGLIRKPGAATTAGLLKGIIELLTGSTHGIAIVLVSLTQGLLVDVVLSITRRYNLASFMLAGGLAAASNVLVFQLLYFSGVPITYILFIACMALISGVLLAGSFGYSVLEIVLQARPFRISGVAEHEMAAARVAAGKKNARMVRIAVTTSLMILLSVGAVYYFAVVFEPPWAGPRCQVEGAVDNPYSFQITEFSHYEKTITAELIGQISHVPPQEYTGVPLGIIVQESSPLPEAAKLKVMASDGYIVEFDLQAVLNDDKMLLIKEDDMLRLIAGNYDGGHWVKMVNKIIVE